MTAFTYKDSRSATSAITVNDQLFIQSYSYLYVTPGVLRTAVIFFYLSNEGVSILENSAHLGLPVPDKLKDVPEQLHNRGGNDNESE